MRASDETVWLFVDASCPSDVVASMCRLITAALTPVMSPRLRVLLVGGRRPGPVIAAYRRLLRAAAPLDPPMIGPGAVLARGYRYGEASRAGGVVGTPTPAVAASGRMRIVPPGRRTCAGLEVVRADLRDPSADGVLRRLADELVGEASRRRAGDVAGALRGHWRAAGLAVGRWSRAELDVDNLGPRPTRIRVRGAGLDIRPTVTTVDVPVFRTATVTFEVRPWVTGAMPVEIRADNRVGYAWLPVPTQRPGAQM